VLDARRCISYLTIELKGPIPRGLRPGIGNRVFGCDVCNEVCPYNRRLDRDPIAPSHARSRDEAHWAPRLVDLLALDEQRFAERFEGTPVMRAKRRGLLRNVCVALGNWADPSAIPALRRALDDQDALVRGHAAWALGRIGTDAAMDALRGASPRETDSWVASELAAALSST
jgi:epoxyqueuosine reductase